MGVWKNKSPRVCYLRFVATVPFPLTSVSFLACYVPLCKQPLYALTLPAKICELESTLNTFLMHPLSCTRAANHLKVLKVTISTCDHDEADLKWKQTQRGVAILWGCVAHSGTKNIGMNYVIQPMKIQLSSTQDISCHVHSLSSVHSGSRNSTTATKSRPCIC